MGYEIEYFSIGDADAILIKYTSNNKTKIVLIDSGNVGDGEKIEKFLIDKWNASQIDLTICTHPDNDHIGGLFYLIKDSCITIKELWVNTPLFVLSNDTHDWFTDEWQEQCLELFKHPTDENSPNLIELALGNDVNVSPAYRYRIHSDVPLIVLGPTEDEYRGFAEEMIKKDKSYYILEELRDIVEEIKELLQEKMAVSSQTKSSIDNESDDNSITNKSSMILCFFPSNEEKFLFLGDATREAIQNIISSPIVQCYIRNCTVKIPHHGSKHNLTSKIVQDLSPVCSIISAKGTINHPSKGVVHCLANCGDVYSTHYNGDITIKNGMLSGSITNSPYKKKIKSS